MRRSSEKVKSEGLQALWRRAREADESHALGSARRHRRRGRRRLTDFRAGDRWLRGTGYATHAEMLSVPRNCARVARRG